jgi:hypothetical protein
MFKQSEYQQLIVDAGALPHLVGLLKRSKSPIISQALFSGLLRKTADTITNLAHENTSIKTLVRFFQIPDLRYMYFADIIFFVLN